MSKALVARHGATARAWTVITTLALAAGLSACSHHHPQAHAHHIAISRQPASEKHQVLFRQVSASPRTLDPSLAEGVPAQRVLEDLFEGLTTLAPNGTVVPGVAKSWTISRDGRVYTFHLRKRARWSNGKPVTAQDFVFAWRREVNPETGAEYAQALNPIKNATAVMTGKLPPSRLGVEAPDSHTFVVHLNAPTPYFLQLLTNNYMYPLYPPAVRRWGVSWTRPGHMVSNGAFMLTSWVVNGHLTLKRNPHYWNVSHVRLRKVVYYPISEPDSGLSQYLAGNLYWTASGYAFPITEKDWVEQHLGNQLKIATYFGNAYLAYMVTTAPFNNRDLRMALSMSLDRKILAKYVMNGLAKPAYSLMPPLRGYRQQLPVWAHWSRAKRDAEAEKLYRKAGYSKKHPLRMRVLYPSGGKAIRHLMEAAQEMWHQVLGADITLYNQQWKVFLQNVQYGHARLFWSAWIGDYADPYTFMQLFLKGFAMNYGHFDDPAYNALIARAGRQTNNKKRYAIFEKAARIINRKMPYIPIYYYVSYRLIKPYVAGWKPNVMDRHLSQYMYILKHSGQ